MRRPQGGAWPPNGPFGERLRVDFGELPGRGFPVKQAEHERGGVGGQVEGAGEIRTEIGPPHCNLAPG